MPKSLLYNIMMDEESGIVHCGRRTCKHRIGLLRYDSIFVILESFRFCDLVYSSSVTEHTTQTYTHLTVNYLVELENPVPNHVNPADLDIGAARAHNYGNNYHLASTIGLPLNEELAVHPNPERFVEREVLDFVSIQNVAEPSNAAVQVAEVSSSSDALERIVNDILGDDEEIPEFIDIGQYYDISGGYYENDFSFL